MASGVLAALYTLTDSGGPGSCQATGVFAEWRQAVLAALYTLNDSGGPGSCQATVVGTIQRR